MLGTTLNFPGYSIESQIYEGERTVVYKGIRDIDAMPVVIKLMQNEYPSFSEIIQFRNQYNIAKNLDIPGIVKPYSLQTYHNGYALFMEYGGISLKEWAKNNNNVETRYIASHIASLHDFLVVAIQIATILDGLHRNRVIHKDIKPANILINPETNQVKIIDFSISSLLPRETQQLQNPNVLEGTLAYISPEQTGRMNRGIDYRTDFYSLGVTFYELLTGELPFISDDPMELVHCHIVKQAASVNSINQNIPITISNIIAKLMAKNAEDRYQSTLGLKHDLETCLYEYKETLDITAFELGSRDISDCFLIPEKLYGRENEVEILLKGFDRVSAGATEMTLVAGFSGIGKTAVVNEVHKPIVRQRGYFIKGKYDQFQRNIPLGAFVQAFRDLIGQLLSESDAQIQEWKSKILDAVGENGQVIIEVIPELERIIGKQEPAPELSGSAAQNRFNLLFQKFTQVFTCAEHPLVIFLDDLQWADSVSLKLMELLMTDTGHLLLIGAYRDNEVNPTHSLMLTLDEIQKNRANINTITLSPLEQDDLNNLVADTLSCTISIARPFSELVYQKTKGNPFFSNQFLKSLYEDGLINFNFEVNHWECDIAHVKALALTNDVVEFMALQLQKLPSATQEILKLAACIGNQFDLTTLSIVYEKSQVDTASDLWKALQEGLILPITEVYKFYQGESNDRLTQEFDQLAKYRFLHDRVQQAAYSLIPDNQKQTTHLKIGQLLLHCSSVIEREEKLFDIVRHLNQGKDLIVPLNERQALAQLNLAAGRKARTSTAYAAAMVYLQTGIGLLKPDCWLSEYDLTLNLYVAAAEAAYLNGDFEGMEQMTLLVLNSSQTILDKIKVYEIQILARIAQSQMLEAIAVARNALQQLGVELPGEPSEAKVGKALQAVNCQLQGRQIQELADLPLMTDATSQAAMQLLAMLFPAVLTGIPSLLPLLSSTMVSLSLQSGNTAASSVGYVIHGMVLCNFLGEVETGYAFGRLALNVLKNLNVQEHKSIVYGIFAGFIQHFQDSESASIPMYKTAYSTGIEIGDFMNSGYAANGYAYTSFFSGAELSNLEQEMVGYSAALGQMKQYSAQAYVNVTRQMVRNFIETTSQPECLIGTAYDETVMIPKHIADNELTIVAMLYIDKILLAYHFGNYTAAIDYATQVKQYLMAAPGVNHIPVLHLYAALSHLAIISTQKEAMQASILAQVEIHQTTLQQRALHAPMNYLHKWYLLEAERQRVLGKVAEAIECYERAITLAKENEYVNEEALANELAAKFYLGWGKEKIAQTYLIEAYYCYARWGAKAKIEDLEKRYSKLLAPIFKERNIIKTGGTIAQTFTNTIHSTSKTTTSVFDLSAIIKASQAISSEIELEKLLSHLMEVILENAGAEKSVLLLLKDKKLLVEVTANSNSKQKNKINIFQHPFEDTQEVPSSIINYVKNTLEVLVIDDASTQTRWVADIYIQREQPKSILCMPILNQSKLIGILYLENRPTIGAFTTDRVELLNLLVSQAAISLENARLYKQAQDNAQQLSNSLSELKQAQLQLVQSEKMSALGNLVAGVAHEINNPVGFIAGNINPALDYVKDVFGLLDLYQQEHQNPSDAITDEIETIDLDYVRSDLPKLLNSMKEGVTRIRSISNSLRTFSRADTENKVSFNIHDGIDSTILILKHRLKADENRPAIEVITDYAKFPQISCFPGQLNQVFMNLIANAIDALDESNKGRSFEEIQQLPNIIKITTRISDDSQHVIISIKDNGKGMSDETKQRIFDHLFTTKGVGKGTGLGLAIAQQIIVEKHGGSIEVNSQLGEGAEFVITIPVE